MELQLGFKQTVKRLVNSANFELTQAILSHRLRYKKSFSTEISWRGYAVGVHQNFLAVCMFLPGSAGILPAFNTYAAETAALPRLKIPENIGTP
jgi:hypothetical protein